MIGYAPLLGEVKLVDRPSFLSQVPLGSGCTSEDIARYQAEMGMYASEIASAQQDMKIAVASGNQFMIDAANGKANLANNNWEVRSNALKQCQALPPTTYGPSIGPVIALLAAVAVVGSVIVIPKLMK